MGKPSKQQIADAIIHSAKAGESMADFDARIAGLSRISDEELSAIGVAPPTCPEPADGPANIVPAPIAPVDPDPPAFAPAPLRPRRDGWTAERQRAFIAALAETGCVSEACAEVGITPRSAYRLREHAAAAGFRVAWEHAESLATARLTALAFERAVHGSVERIYRDGVLVEERRKPSDKLLMWLLSHRDPVGYGWLTRPPRETPHSSFYPLQSARSELPHLLGGLADIGPEACAAEPIPGEALDYDAEPPRA
ncbi:MAG TPA: hypothetical protein VFU20_06075 [Sphingomicrobium sp.]|nr:hypothetical protein [Sphingomicrobium sp.]